MVDARRRGVGTADSAARPQASRSCPRGVHPDGAAADGSLRGHRLAGRWAGDADDRCECAAAHVVRPGEPPGGRAVRAWRRGRGPPVGRPGVPLSAHAFSGLVYRQVVDHLKGVRDLAATRELIVRENMRYAKRQVTWFRKEPGVAWLDAPGETLRREARRICTCREVPGASPEPWPRASPSSP